MCWDMTPFVVGLPIALSFSGSGLELISGWSGKRGRNKINQTKERLFCSMTEKGLKKLLVSGETETLEFKQSLTESFYETTSAFSNARGGVILLGVDKKGNITGVDPSSEFLEDLTNRIVNKMSIYPQIETIDIDQKRVLSVKIARLGFPISYESRYYERVGNTTREMSPEKLQALV